MRCLGFHLLLQLTATVTFLSPSGAVVIGLPPDPATGNCIPFGCAPRESTSGRYQQLYDSDGFAGPIEIAEIRFFMTEFLGGLLPDATLEIRLSTTTLPVDSLDASFADPGPDEVLFSITHLTGGPAPAALSLPGSPFLFDPSLGNLLLDVVAVDYIHPCNVSDTPNAVDCAFFDKKGGPLEPATEFSKATDWGLLPAAFSSGLVTEFVAIPEPGTGALLGLGLSLGFAFRSVSAHPSTRRRNRHVSRESAA